MEKPHIHIVANRFWIAPLLETYMHERVKPLQKFQQIPTWSLLIDYDCNRENLVLFQQVSYGAASSAFSQKSKFPFFLRTVHSNKDHIDVIINIILHFNWRWVAFLNSDNDFGIDGLEVFRKRIKDTDICLAYTKSLSEETNYSLMFKQLEAQKVNIIVVFATNVNSEAVIESAVRLNVTSKVWIAGENWSLNKRLMKMKGIQTIGTVIGVSQPMIAIPGFSDFIYSIKSHTLCKNTEENQFCYQNCNGSSLLPEDIISMDPSYSFQVYSAVYANAHALHNVLQCGAGKCNKNIKVYPYMVSIAYKYHA